MYQKILVCLLSLTFTSWSWGGLFAQQAVISSKTYADGVVQYHHSGESASEPWFFRIFNNLYQVVFSADSQPFGKSIALLVGVADYQYLSQDLPSVKNDLSDMKDFLLGKGGFDEVYVAAGEIVNKTLVERYIKKVLPKQAGKDGRILFYYSGHGGDARGGRTGYMQFSQAKPDHFFGDQVLKINDIYDWSSEIEVKHFLSMLDCCTSGLAFSPRFNKAVSCDDIIINTLSGNGSRYVMTAGTGKQKAYALKGRKDHGNGVFTKAFLNAFEGLHPEFGQCSMYTIEEIHSYVLRQAALFAGPRGKKLTPRLWELEGHKDGTFLFCHPNKRKAKLSKAQIEASGAEAVRKGDPIEVIDYGALRLVPQVTGDLYIDKQYYYSIKAFQGVDLFLKVGKHIIELKTPSQSFAKRVNIVKGKQNRLLVLGKESSVDRPFTSNPSRQTAADHSEKVANDGDKAVSTKLMKLYSNIKKLSFMFKSGMNITRTSIGNRYFVPYEFKKIGFILGAAIDFRVNVEYRTLF